MNWDLNTVTARKPLVQHNFTVEGNVSGWLKRFARERKVGVAHAIRVLVGEAVSYWLKNQQSLERKIEPYPFGIFADGERARIKNMTVSLDHWAMNGLQQISQATGKSVSQIVSEILLDAKNAHAEIVAARSSFGGAQLKL